MTKNLPDKEQKKEGRGYQYSESCEIVFFAIVLSIKLLLIQQSNLDCSSLFYWQLVLSGFAIKEVRISEVLLYVQCYAEKLPVYGYVDM